MTSTFLPLHINVRSKLWRPLALSPEVTMTSNFDCDLLVPTNNYGVIVSLKFQSSIFIASASLDSRPIEIFIAQKPVRTAVQNKAFRRWARARKWGSPTCPTG